MEWVSEHIPLLVVRKAMPAPDMGAGAVYLEQKRGNLVQALG